MKITYATNLRCGKCLAVITPPLDNDPRISHWEADLSHRSKLLSVELNGDGLRELVPQLLQQAGYEATPFDTQKEDEAIAEDSGFSLQRYFPLLLVLMYVVGLTAFCEMLLGELQSARAMSHFMGFFFLGFAFFKLLDVARFADAFATYDVVAARSRAYAMSYPFVELTLGLLYLFRKFPIFTNIATILIMAVGLVGVVQAVRAKREIQCACLGTAFNLPMSSVTIIENTVMMLMAAAMLAQQL